MYKHFRLAALALLTAALFGACSDDNPEPRPVTEPYPTPPSGALLVCQGSMYNGIDGSLSALNLSTNTLRNAAFRAANGQSLGDTPQNATVYGSKVYVSVFGSNLLWVLDRATLRILAQIETTQPEWVTAAEGSVYVANNDGFVSKVDTTALRVTAQLPVGPNPACLLPHDGFLCVSISDGYNAAGGYLNGQRIKRIRLNDFTDAGDIPVGLNPGRLISGGTDGSLFVVCQGNWADITPTIWRVKDDGTAAEFCPGSMAAVVGSWLYVINSVTDWDTYTTTTDYTAYLIANGSVARENFLHGELPPSPTFIECEPSTGDLYIGSRASSYDYTSPGFLYRYDKDGTLLQRHTAATEPYALTFF